MSIGGLAGMYSNIMPYRAWGPRQTVIQNTTYNVRQQAPQRISNAPFWIAGGISLLMGLFSNGGLSGIFGKKDTAPAQGTPEAPKQDQHAKDLADLQAQYGNKYTVRDENGEFALYPKEGGEPIRGKSFSEVWNKINGKTGDTASEKLKQQVDEFNKMHSKAYGGCTMEVGDDGKITLKDKDGNIIGNKYDNYASAIKAAQKHASEQITSKGTTGAEKPTQEQVDAEIQTFIEAKGIKPGTQIKGKIGSDGKVTYEYNGKEYATLDDLLAANPDIKAGGASRPSGGGRTRGSNGHRRSTGSSSQTHTTVSAHETPSRASAYSGYYEITTIGSSYNNAKDAGDVLQRYLTSTYGNRLNSPMDTSTNGKLYKEFVAMNSKIFNSDGSIKREAMNAADATIEFPTEKFLKDNGYIKDKPATTSNTSTSNTSSATASRDRNATIPPLNIGSRQPWV